MKSVEKGAFSQQSSLVSDDPLDLRNEEEEREFEEWRKTQDTLLLGMNNQQKWVGEQLAELRGLSAQQQENMDMALQDIKSLLCGNFELVSPPVLALPFTPEEEEIDLVENSPEEQKVGVWWTFMNYLTLVVNSMWFDGICTLVILCNAVFIGESVEYAVEKARLGEPSKNDLIVGIEYGFFTFYVIELIMKLAVHKYRFFTKKDRKWNILDFFLVLTAVFDLLYDAFSPAESKGDSKNMTWMRLLRLLKMMKMLRVVRVMRSFRALRVMFYSIAAAVRSLMWAMVMLILIMYIFGLCLIQGATGYLQDTDDPEPQTEEDIRKYYSTVLDTIIALFMAITGGNDWSVFSECLREVSAVYHLIFLFYIAFTALAVLNVLTGIFVDMSFDAVQTDKDTSTHESASNNALLTILGRDPDISDRRLSQQEFHDTLRQGKIQPFLASIEIEVPEACTLFKELMSVDGFVDIDEFEEGLLKIKGLARAIDMMSLTHDFLKYTKQMSHFMSVVEENFCSLQKILHGYGCTTGRVTSLGERLRAREAERSKVRRDKPLPKNDDCDSCGL